MKRVLFIILLFAGMGAVKANRVGATGGNDAKQFAANAVFKNQLKTICQAKN